MTAFEYRHGRLHCEGVPLERIAEQVGTPVYVYSAGAITSLYRAYEQALDGMPHLVCYAVKANMNLAVLSLLARLGAGADVVSGGELFRALRAGFEPRKIVFAGVGKTREEIREGLKADVLTINVESPAELHVVDEEARAHGGRARVAFRVNPDIDPQTHPYIATGLKTSKFGVPYREARDLYRQATALAGIEVVGIHMHGLGIRYRDETPPAPGEYVRTLQPALGRLGLTVLLEPGRSIVGNAGALLARVIYRKATEGKRFVIVDAAMNDLIRPALYNAHHEIWPVAEAPATSGREVVDVVGPVCESGDFLAQERALPPVGAGDLLAVLSAGAYGFAMASNYNARSRAAEVMVSGERFQVVRRRESYEDQMVGERSGVEVLG